MQIVRQLCSGLVLVIAMIHSAVFADHIVLQSDTDEYSIGQVLQDPLTLLLNDGKHIVLMSEQGDVFDIDGPFTGAPNGSHPDEFDLKKALSSLIDQAAHRHASLGSTRLGGTRISAPEARPAWKLNPFETGSQCVIAGLPVRFWRTEPNDELLLVMQRPGSVGTGEIFWPAGKSESDWPESIPIADDELYVVRRPGWMQNAMIRLKILPAAVTDNVESSVAWLAVNGCKSQAEMLLDAVP